MQHVRHTIEYTQDVSSWTAQKIANMNLDILKQSGHFNHPMQFSVHKTTGFVRQIPNNEGWIYTDDADVKCRIVIASDIRRPMIVCDESPLDPRVMDVICAMDDIVST